MLDTPVGTDGGITLDTLALATRLVSRELDHTDPVPGRYTLEVTSPGVERTLRTVDHFRRAVGELVAVRLRDVAGGDRRIEGVLVAADDQTVTVRPADAPAPIDADSTTESSRSSESAGHDESDDANGAGDRVVPIDQIDRARTVFVWAAQPKPGAGGSRGRQSNHQSSRHQSGSKSPKPKEKKSS